MLGARAVVVARSFGSPLMFLMLSTLCRFSHSRLVTGLVNDSVGALSEVGLTGFLNLLVSGVGEGRGRGGGVRIVYTQERGERGR